jgi:hypothetical protein
MSREAGRWNIDLGIESRRFRKAARASQPKEGSRMKLPEEASKKPAILNTKVIQFADDREKPYVCTSLPWS